MPYLMVDVESDGPIPGDFSMISFGAVLVDEKLDKTFYGRLKPISDNYIPEALNVPENRGPMEGLLDARQFKVDIV